MGYLFTSESVSEGHPDKVADQISDAVLDKLLAYDPSSKVACETLVTTGQVVLAGEVKTKAYVDMPLIAREVIKKIGYTKGEYMFESNSCGVLSAIHEQSPDINRGVERQDPMEQGAGVSNHAFGNKLLLAKLPDKDSILVGRYLSGDGKHPPPCKLGVPLLLNRFGCVP